MFGKTRKLEQRIAELESIIRRMIDCTDTYLGGYDCDREESYCYWCKGSDNRGHEADCKWDTTLKEAKLLVGESE